MTIDVKHLVDLLVFTKGGPWSFRKIGPCGKIYYIG